MQLSEAIKDLRRKTFYSQEAFANILSVTVGTINRWENGKSRPNITAMKKLQSFCSEQNYSFEEIEQAWRNEEKGDFEND